MAGESFDVNSSAGFYDQEKEYYARKIATAFPDRAEDSSLVYGDPKREYFSLVNEGLVPDINKGEPGAKGATGNAGAAGGIVVSTTLANTVDANAQTTPGVFIQPGSTVALNWPSTSKGHLFVFGSNAANTVHQEFWPSSSTVANVGRFYYVRELYGAATWSPWRIYGSQRTVSTAAVGKAIYMWDEATNTEVLVYGESGDRNISTLLTGAAGNVSVRRNGNAVVVTFNDVAPTAASADLLILTLPAGFRPTVASNKEWATASETAQRLFTITSAGAIRVANAATTDIYRKTLTFFTSEAWPTALPGTVQT